MATATGNHAGKLASQTPTDSPDSAMQPPSRLHLYYGGTFDPFHDGHLAIARAARDELGVPVALLPAADPPHRPPPGADARQRLRMLELGTAGEPGLYVDDRELRRAQRQPGRPSYTVDTLRELRAEWGPALPIAWLMGADSFAGLEGWHEWQALPGLAHLVLAERADSPLAGYLPPALADWLATARTDRREDLSCAPAGRIWVMHQPLRPESATQVRELIAAGDPGWQARVPAAVARYIAGHGLYGSAA